MELWNTIYDDEIYIDEETVLPQVTWACIDKDGKVMALQDHHKIEIEGYETVLLNKMVKDHSKIDGMKYDIETGTAYFDEELWKEVEIEKEKRVYRARRDMDCFPYINRGKLWYENEINTEERKKEFQEWYQAWLDVTETKTIPEKPEWLK